MTISRSVEKKTVLMLKLKVMVIGLAILSAVSLSIYPEILSLSGPEALEVSFVPPKTI